MSKTVATNTCPECGGRLLPRMTGFKSCEACGKLVVVGKTNRPEPQAEGKTTGQSLDSLNLPDFAECMTGWRAWGVEAPSDGLMPVLRSVTWGDYFWMPREAQQATCSRNADHVPGETCSCGFYSAKTREHLESMAYHKYDAEQRGLFHVIGSVSLWGKVIEGSQGWRAQFGYPSELFVPYEAHHLAAPLAEAYGVPVRLDNVLRDGNPYNQQED